MGFDINVSQARERLHHPNNLFTRHGDEFAEDVLGTSQAGQDHF